MRYSYFLSLLITFFCFSLNAQLNVELKSQLDVLLEAYPREVLVGKDNIEQEITYNEATPYRIIISQTEEGDETITMEVNLGLITKVRDYSHKRDGISVILSSGTTATIKAYEGEEVDGYLKETSILAEDINNGREMEEVLKKILPLAETAWETATALPTGAIELQQFMGDRVVNHSFGDEEYTQSMEFMPGVGSAKITIGGSANKEEETTYLLNLADLDPKQIDIAAKGSEINVSLETKSKRKYIEVVKEEDKRFESSFDIIFGSFDEAQVFTYSLKALIKETESAAKAEIPAYSSTDEAAKALSKLLSQADITNVEQKIETNCRTTYDIRDGEDEFSFQFDFADFEVKDLSLNPKGAVVFLPLETKSNQKFIGVREGGEIDNYENEFELQFNAIAPAKTATYAIEYLVKNCPTEISTPSMDMILLLLNGAERKNGEITQAAEVSGNKACSMVLTQTENGKKTDEAIYEFNLYDLDHKSGKIEVKGTEVNVSFMTNGKENIIQLLENNEEQTYTNTILFFTTDLASAKTLLTGISAAATGCAEDKR